MARHGSPARHNSLGMRLRSQKKEPTARVDLPNWVPAWRRRGADTHRELPGRESAGETDWQFGSERIVFGFRKRSQAGFDGEVSERADGEVRVGRSGCDRREGKKEGARAGETSVFWRALFGLITLVA